MTSILFSNCLVMRDARTAFEPAPWDILVEGDRIAAIEPHGTLGHADRIVDASGMLAASGMINGRVVL